MLLIAAVLFAASNPAWVRGGPLPQGPAVVYREQRVGSAALQIVDADLNRPQTHVTVQMAESCPGSAEPFAAMIRRSRPTAAMNGAYFSKEFLAPIGDIVVESKRVYSGDFKTALVIGQDGRASVRRHGVGERVDWSDCRTVLACGPALVLDGRIDWEPDARNHHDPHVTGAVTRMGVGVTPDNHLLLVAAHGSLTFAGWADVMKRLGCRDALNLDSGASRALYYRGRYLIQPGRDLTNLLLVYESDMPADMAVLVPPRQESRRAHAGYVYAAPLPRLPENDSANRPTDLVTVPICADSGGRANAFCPTTVKRSLLRRHVPSPCRMHRVPPGESGAR